MDRIDRMVATRSIKFAGLSTGTKEISRDLRKELLAPWKKLYRGAR